MSECISCWPHPDHIGDCFPHCPSCRREEEVLHEGSYQYTPPTELKGDVRVR